MATREELISALRQADAAGDAQAAQRFAELIRSQPQASAESFPGQSTLSPEALKLPPDQQQQLLQARRRQQEVGGLIQPGEETIVPGNVRRAQLMEQLRQENPALAQTIEEMGWLDRGAVGFQQGLRTVGRGAGKLAGADLFPELNAPEHQTLRDVSLAASSGKIIGEAAPFVAAAPVTGTVGSGLSLTRGGATLVPRITSTGGRSLASGGLGASEGASIAAGEDRSSGEVALSALLGGAIGAGAEVLPAAARGANNQLPRQLVEEGEELLSRTPSSGELSRSITEATPTVEQLRETSRAIFDEVDSAGITIRGNSYRNLLRDIRSQAENSGLDPVNTPQANRAMERLEELMGENPTFRQLDQVRETAQVAAGNLQNRKEAMLGSQIIDSIDEFLNTVDNQMVQGGNVGDRVRVARELWGRSRRSEMINEAMRKAQDQASGFENGIRIQFRQILNNTKKRRMFNREEVQAMEQVVRGTRSANLFKFLGRMAPTEGQATSFLGASVGAGGGAAIGSAVGGATGAGVGAVVLPAIGMVSRNLAQRLTRNNAEFANRIIRAGRDSNQIARAYMMATPANQRSAQELSELFMRQEVDLDTAGLDIAREAAEIARRQRQQQMTAAATGATTTAAAAEEENP